MPISRKEADDAQFKVYFGARDGQLALIGEIKRVQSYHESLKSRLRSAFDAYNGYLDKDTGLVDAAKNSITAEIARTSAFLTSYKSTQDPKEKVKLISAFDDRYPINYKQLLRQEKGGFIAIRRTFDAIFLQAERQNILESFRNISNDNKPTYSQYDDLFTKMSAEFAKFERPALMEQVNRLPPQFTSLANRDDYESMSADDVSSAVERYLSVLRKSDVDLKAFSSDPETMVAQVKSIESSFFLEMIKLEQR